MTQTKIAGIRGCSSAYIGEIERAAKKALKKRLEMNELIYSYYCCRSSYPFLLLCLILVPASAYSVRFRRGSVPFL